MRIPPGRFVFADPVVRVAVLALGLWLLLRVVAGVGLYLELFLVAAVLLLGGTALARQWVLQAAHARLESDHGRLCEQARLVQHDFNNLIQIIVGVSAKLLSGLSPRDRLRRDVETIRETAERAATLAGQLSGSSARPSRERAPVDLNATLESVAPLLGSLAGERVDLRVRVDPDLAVVWADRSQVERVVLNLVVNAIDAMPDGGTLQIETHGVLLDEGSAEVRRGVPPGPYSVLTVADTGEGMSEQTLQRIFEPFFTTKPRGKGTGLGLSTVHAVMAEMGGYIDVQSQPGSGTRFRLFAPGTPRRGLASGGDPILPAEPFVR